MLGRAVLKKPGFFLLRTALTDSPQGPPTANRQPPTANRQPSTANRQPPTVNRQPSTTRYCAHLHDGETSSGLLPTTSTGAYVQQKWIAIGNLCCARIVGWLRRSAGETSSLSTVVVCNGPMVQRRCSFLERLCGGDEGAQDGLESPPWGTPCIVVPQRSMAMWGSFGTHRAPVPKVMVGHSVALSFGV